LTERSVRPSARRLAAALATIALALSACATGGGAGICEAAGGTYAGGTCSRWSPVLEAAKRMCETRGGVFLAGQDTCAFGMGGP
jgi:hypothetical protein